MVVAAPVALVACDGEKDQRRTAIADERNPLRSARENGGGEEGRTAAVAAGGRKLGRKLGFFFVERRRAIFK
jgi:hypothetical protein